MFTGLVTERSLRWFRRIAGNRGSCVGKGQPHSNLLRRPLMQLECRLTPAELLHSLFPDPTGPQSLALFGTSVAVSSSYRVVSAPGADVFGQGVGQAFVFD